MKGAGNNTRVNINKYNQTQLSQVKILKLIRSSQTTRTNEVRSQDETNRFKP